MNMRGVGLVSTVCLMVVLAGSLSSCNDKKMMAMVPPPVTVGPMAAPDGITGQAYAFMVQASGGTAPYTLLETTGTPLFPMGQGAMGTPCQGLALNLMTGAISGTPINAGTCGPFMIRATDSSNPALTATVTLNIRIAAPLSISTNTLPNGTDDVAYNQTITTAGGLAPLTFSVSTGMLPPGLNLNANSGVISGTPTTGGNFNFTVQVRDSLSPQQSVTRAFAVLVFEISTTSLPNGTLNQSYAQALAAVGGVGNITWALAAGSGPLPGGLALNAMGMISGMPNATGTFNLTVQATDSDNPARMDTQALSITVVNPVPNILTLTPSAAQAGDPAFILTVDGMDFVPGAEVRWNGSARTTTFVNSSQVTASIPASDVAVAGMANVQVNNPAPGGGLSNTLTFTISAGPNPVPAVTTLQPSSTVEGTANLSLTVLGSGFVSNSVVQWNGMMRTTTFVSGGELQAAIPGSDLTTAGMAQVTVFNPAPGGGTSNSLTFTINPAPPMPGIAGSDGLVSVNLDGTDATVVEINGSILYPSISGTGRYVAFFSPSNNIVAGVAGGIFVRNTVTKTSVSISPTGLGPTAISPDGRHVAFRSGVTEVAVHDRDVDGNGILDEAGATATAVTGLSFFSTQGFDRIAMSPDARFLASVISTGVFVHNRDSDGNGVFDEMGGTTTVQVNVASDGTPADTNDFGSIVAISPNGRFAAFCSSATNLVAGDSNAVTDAFVRDRDVDGNGILDEANTPGMEDKVKTVRISVASDGTQGNQLACEPVGAGGYTVFLNSVAMSADGRFVTFQSSATNLVAGDTNSRSDVFVRDRDVDGNGIFDEANTAGMQDKVKTVRANVSSSGAQSQNFEPSGGPDISADGRFVAFWSEANNLVTADNNGSTGDVFVHDRDADGNGFFDETCGGCISTVRVSVFLPGDGTRVEGSFPIFSPVISADGRFVAFISQSFWPPVNALFRPNVWLAPSGQP